MTSAAFFVPTRLIFPNAAARYMRRLLFAATAGLLLGGCSTSAPTVPANACFLADTEERFHSEILQGEQRVVMQIELVDGVRPAPSADLEQLKGRWVPEGARRVQFRVYLPPVGWNDGRPREARAAVDVDLQAGHRYKVAGKLKDGLREFYLVDIGSGKPVTDPIDMGFFAPVEGPKGFIPIIIPMKR